MTDTASIKTIIVDLDRTLLHTDKTISAHTVKVLEKCKKSGINIMVATARPLRTTKPYCDMIDFDAMVVSNGARVVHGNQQTDYGIGKNSAERLLNTLKHCPELRITLETGDCAYSNHPIEEYETILSDNLTDIADKEGVLKILVHLDSEENLHFVREALTEDLYYTIAHGYLMQIMSTSAAKWKGIQAMLDICNCTPDETAYFGDDQDDIEPIKMCGLGIAVSNGIPEAKAAADYITESNDEDGVAEFIEQRILKDSMNPNPPNSKNVPIRNCGRTR
ncbi:MAG: HAD family hydrolase [Ruminococcaceae bacterium]|nr:HAD family hydrolase [Oscillospiraceae bacterium]